MTHFLWLGPAYDKRGDVPVEIERPSFLPGFFVVRDGNGRRYHAHYQKLRPCPPQKENFAQPVNGA